MVRAGIVSEIGRRPTIDCYAALRVELIDRLPLIHLVQKASVDFGSVPVGYGAADNAEPETWRPLRLTEPSCSFFRPKMRAFRMPVA